jgi:hypothetical protein
MGKAALVIIVVSIPLVTGTFFVPSLFSEAAGHYKYALKHWRTGPPDPSGPPGLEEEQQEQQEQISEPQGLPVLITKVDVHVPPVKG